MLLNLELTGERAFFMEEDEMIGIYFSGTGNSRHCVEKFLQEYEGEGRAFPIEDRETAEQVYQNDEIVFGYPVQYSAVPKIVQDYICGHKALWKGKRIFVIATMGAFSGDGAGILARLLETYGAVITGGLHLKMPDSICDEKVLKRTMEKNRKIVADGEKKIRQAAEQCKSGNPPQNGIGIWCRMAGFFGQRLYFGSKTKRYSDKLKVNKEKCIGCGKCVKLCPMDNLSIANGKAEAGDRCTLCYRCVNHCQAQAITLLGKRVVEQSTIEKYL